MVQTIIPFKKLSPFAKTPKFEGSLPNGKFAYKVYGAECGRLAINRYISSRLKIFLPPNINSYFKEIHSVNDTKALFESFKCEDFEKLADNFSDELKLRKQPGINYDLYNPGHIIGYLVFGEEVLLRKFDEYDTKSMMLKFERLSDFAFCPLKIHPNDVGFDVFSPYEYMLEPKKLVEISTDLAFEPPPGSLLKIESRSGLAKAFSIQVFAGIIDSNYRGNVKVLLMNHGETNFLVRRGYRIGQIILYLSPEVYLWETKKLSITERRANGLGSTGLDGPNKETSVNLLDLTNIN